jgi:hypothetical protein
MIQTRFVEPSRLMGVTCPILRNGKASAMCCSRFRCEDSVVQGRPGGRSRCAVPSAAELHSRGEIVDPNFGPKAKQDMYRKARRVVTATRSGGDGTVARELSKVLLG